MDYNKIRQYITIRNKISEKLEINPFLLSRQFFFWILIGLIGGSIASLYWIVLEFFLHYSATISGWWLIPMMTIAGLALGLIIHFIGNPGEIELIVNNIRFKGGRLDPQNNTSMILSSLIGISAGGSAGPEAPLVQVTGSTGTWLAKKLRLKGENLRSLSIAGMAAGFTALFGAPLGSGFFALEILHHKHMVEYYQALIPAFVSSCAAYAIFLFFTHIGVGPVWKFPEYTFSGLGDYSIAIGAGVVGAAIGWLFIVIFRISKKWFAKINQIYLRTTLGGLILGIIAFILPVTRFFSHHEITELITHDYTILLLLAILILKIIAVCITVTSGWRGGFIIPLFFIGACVGLIILYFFPQLNPALVMVSCMAAVNACVTRTPISTIILLSSLTGFHQFIPIMFGSLTGFFLAPKTPLIASQLKEI